MRSEEDRLEDILASIRIIEAQVAGMDEPAFLTAFAEDLRFADALCFRLVVIGEAVAALIEAARREPSSSRVLEANPEIEWSGYVGMRNIIAYRYFRRDPAAIWVTLEDELQELKRAIQETVGRR